MSPSLLTKAVSVVVVRVSVRVLSPAVEAFASFDAQHL